MVLTGTHLHSYVVHKPPQKQGNQTGKTLNSATLEYPSQDTSQNNDQQNQNRPSNPSQHAHEAAKSSGLSLVSDVRFTDFNVSDSLKNRLTSAGFTLPTPVQAKAIPPALEGADILATASTGTGKTLSFLIPMIQRMDANSVPSTKGKRG